MEHRNKRKVSRMQWSNDTGKKVAFCGLILTLSLIAGYAESLLPVFVAIPGIKLGLANSVILLLLYEVGIKEAFAVSITRVLLSGFMFGSMSSILYSLAGALSSLTGMAILKKSDCFSITGVSMAGGVMHNIGQLAVACVVLETTAVWYYLPVLMIAGCVTGLVIGILTGEIQKRIF